jgi:diguanylate cyclase (GGDEF)-like protein
MNVQSRKKIELLRRVDLFSELREYELDVIARHSDFVTIEKGLPLFNQDDPADSLYVRESGRIGIVSIEDRSRVSIAQMEAGEAFGHLDFLSGGRRRASAFAEADSVALKFPAGDRGLGSIFSGHAYISSRLVFRLLEIVSDRIWNVKKALLEKSSWIWDLHKQALSDKLTGLYNSSYLKEDFINLLPGLGKSAALVMIKPDNFKDINDRCGHEAGDRALRLMAIFLQSELGENDAGIRYHGDEFAAILAGVSRTEATARCRAMNAAFRAMDLSGITGDGELRLQVSMGMALYPEGAEDSGTMVKKAHEKMMTARASGGNRLCL